MSRVFETAEEFLEWLEDFEPPVNSQVAGSGIVK